MIKTKPINQYKCKCKCGEPAAFVAGIFKFATSGCVNRYALSILRKEKVKQVKTYNADTKRRKDALNDTVPLWTKKVQKEFNKFIRARDYGQPCISCGREDSEIKHTAARGGKWDCGHYKSVGSAPELRFEEHNAHAQCKHCNQYLSGNVVEYRKGLLKRIGPIIVEWIERKHEPKYYRVPELKEMHKKFIQLTKEKLKGIEQ